MKTSMIKNRRPLILIACAIGLSMFLTRCTKTKVETVETTDPKIEDVIVPNSEIQVPVNFVLDTSFNNEKSHSNVNWKSRYFDFSETYLTGRFAEFEFVPDFPVAPNKLGGAHQAGSKGILNQNLNYNPNYPATAFFSAGPNVSGPPAYFRFNASDLSKNYLKFYVLVSTACTSEPGRDNYLGCGQNYYGVVFTDSTRQVVDPKCDTAWLEAKSWSQQGNGYLVKCDFTFNRYLPTVNGADDGVPIKKSVDVYLTYNGSYDFVGATSKTLRCGFTASFRFNRSDFMDKNATKVYIPHPKASEKANSDLAFAANKTYGAYSGSVGDEMLITAYMVFSKVHQ